MTNEKPSRRLFSRTCTECGETFETTRVEAEFCCKEHRMAWHNRRRDRGAIVYDILMTGRFDRDFAAKEGLVWTTELSNLAQHFRNADKTHRAGRKSWEKHAHQRLPIAYSDAGFPEPGCR